MPQLRIKMMTQRSAFQKKKNRTGIWSVPQAPHENFARRFQCKGTERGIFKPVTGNESLHEASNDNGVRVVNFATLKNLIVKSTFPHHDIHKHTWTSPDGVTHNHRDHVLIDKRQHSNILDIRSLRRTDFDSEHYMLVIKLRERIQWANEQGKSLI
jgi:hypothetical protein